MGAGRLYFFNGVGPRILYQSLIGPEKAWGILDLGEWLVLPAAESDN